MRLVAGHVGTAERDHHGHIVQIEKRKQRAGGKGEEEVRDLIVVLAEQAADHRARGDEIARRVEHAGLVQRAAAAPHPVHGEHSLLVGVAVPQQLRAHVVVGAAGHHVHSEPASRQRARQHLGRHAGAAAVGWVLVVEQQYAQRHRPDRWSGSLAVVERVNECDRGRRKSGATEGDSGGPEEGGRDCALKVQENGVLDRQPGAGVRTFARRSISLTAVARHRQGVRDRSPERWRTETGRSPARP